MKYIPPKFETLSEMAAIDAARLTEDEARAILEKIRWPEGPVCPHCNSKNVTRIQAKSNTVRDGVIQCNECRKQFTVTVGTIMHRSHITLRQWVQAYYSMCSHKKGVSALQLQRNLGLHSYKAAWHLAHRIRFAMREEPLASALSGTIEADETYIGGKTHGGKRGRGAPKKTVVLALVERKGRVRARPIETVSAKELKGAIRENVDKGARIMTDELGSYKGIGKEFDGGHKVVRHGIGEYVRGENHEIHVNGAESYFALLKRGIHGTFHHVSKKHLHRYCDEFNFRWDERKTTDGERAVAAIKGSEGKRLVYRATT
ncbi:MAG: IS1595 family transposase [Thermodesulfobacteriota bacterium]